MQKRKKIIFIITSLAGGGAEQMLINLLLLLDKNIYEPVLLLFKKEGPLIDFLPKDLRVVDLKKKNKLSFFLLIFQIKSLIMTEKPDLIVSFITYANYVSVISKIFSGLKTGIILTEHSVVSRCVKTNFFKKALITFSYSRAKVVITVSEGCKQELIKDFQVPKGKILVIKNGIDLDKIKSLANEEIALSWFKEKVPILLSIGRLTRAKNFSFLLKVFAKLKLKRDIRLVIIGEGEEYSMLRELARVLGIEESVLFLSFQINPYKFMKQATVFTVSSLWESFSLVILEAMALGVPVVSMDCPYGPREIIKDGINGSLIPLGNIDAFAAAIEKLLTDTGLKNKFVIEGLHYSENFSIQKMVKGYEEVFQKVINNN